MNIIIFFRDFFRPGNNHFFNSMTFPGFPWPYEPCISGSETFSSEMLHWHKQQKHFPPLTVKHLRLTSPSSECVTTYFTGSLWDTFIVIERRRWTLPTVFGTKVMSTVLVFPVVIRVFCRTTPLESPEGGVFPAAVVDGSADAAVAVASYRGHRELSDPDQPKRSSSVRVSGKGFRPREGMSSRAEKLKTDTNQFDPLFFILQNKYKLQIWNVTHTQTHKCKLQKTAIVSTSLMHIQMFTCACCRCWAPAALSRL